MTGFVRSMFGGDSSNPVFPVLMEESQCQYNGNGLPQLQLFGNFGLRVDPLNYASNGHMNCPAKRSREAESTSAQPNFHISLNNNLCKNEVGESGSIMNPNAVSTGLKLSYEEDEHNSPVTTASKSMRAALPGILSLGDNLKTEIDRQKVELDNYIRVQEANITKGVRELNQRHALSFLSAIEKGVGTKLHEKELESETMNRKNRELMERMKQITFESQSWQYRAKYTESVVNVLQNNLKHALMQEKEGCGDTEVDDAASYTNANNHTSLGGSRNPVPGKKLLRCRGCRRKDVCVLLLPCRHLCLCKDCEGFIEVCPNCRVVKTASVEVYMS